MFDTKPPFDERMKNREQVMEEYDDPIVVVDDTNGEVLWRGETMGDFIDEVHYEDFKDDHTVIMQERKPMHSSKRRVWRRKHRDDYMA